MKRVGDFRIGFLILLGISLSACAGQGMGYPAAAPVPYPPPGYAHRVETPQVGLYYNCTSPEPGLLRLEGFAFNVWNMQPVRFLELALEGVDSRERMVSEAVGEVRDYQILTGQSTPFQAVLRPSGSEVRYDLYYQYQFSDGDHRDLISGPIVSGVFPRHTGIRFLARDACSPTQHVMR
ncbi:MAG TPA: hypothetical protein VLM91_12425 [Candidatus Methylomirabilis sp.]|nr:hypothetical protein [Candidatus Methylomirabilis sp.]